MLYNKVIQLYMYTHPCSFRFFSLIDYHRIWGRVLCAVQKVPVGQSFHRPQCARANPKPPVHPPTLVLFGDHTFFKVCESVSVLQISLSVSFSFRFQVEVTSYNDYLSLSNFTQYDRFPYLDDCKECYEYLFSVLLGAMQSILIVCCSYGL